MNDIKPSPDEEKRIIGISEKLLEKARDEIEKRGVDASPILVGSVAKGTFLKDPDIDIFIRFSPSYSKKDMENIGLEIAREIIPNGYESYAEHPYLRGKIDGFKVDIVPCYHVENAANKLSSVDRTPFHTEYVRAHLDDEQRDEVRLLKSFMKGIGAYGAEARIRGFSGYLCELLIIEYGSFLNVLKNAAKWKRRVYIDLGNGGKKFNDPLVFIDPVDSSRNVASAVSEETKALFTLAAKSFIKEPRREFFFPKEIESLPVDELKKIIESRGTSIFVIRFNKPDLIDDVLYPQISRTQKAFRDILRDFNPVNLFYYVDKEVVFVVELERNTLPIIEKHEGPPVWHENADKFMERWKNNAFRGPYIDGYRLIVERKRKLRGVEEVLNKGLKNYKLGKYFEQQKELIKLEKMEEVVEELNRRELSYFFVFKFPWER